MGIKVKELNDFECGYVISGLIELKKLYSQDNANEEDYNSVLGLIEDFNFHKVYIGERL